MSPSDIGYFLKFNTVQGRILGDGAVTVAGYMLSGGGGLTYIIIQIYLETKMLLFSNCLGFLCMERLQFWGGSWSGYFHRFGEL